jgi:hypothetical protein
MTRPDLRRILWSNSLAKQYAAEHRKFLRENAPEMFKSLSQSGTLWKHLHSVGEQASEMFEHLMAQKVNDKAEQEKPYHQRVEALQSHRLAVEEMVRHDLIYQPEPE